MAVSFQKRLPRGVETKSFCRVCGNEFVYVYLTKARTKCDACQKLQHVDRNHDRYHTKVKVRQSHYTEWSRQKETKGMGRRPVVRRDEFLTRSDLLHMPTDRAIDAINAILRGERGLV